MSRVEIYRDGSSVTGNVNSVELDGVEVIAGVDSQKALSVFLALNNLLNEIKSDTINESNDDVVWMVELSKAVADGDLSCVGDLQECARRLVRKD